MKLCGRIQQNKTLPSPKENHWTLKNKILWKFYGSCCCFCYCCLVFVFYFPYKVTMTFRWGTIPGWWPGREAGSGINMLTSPSDLLPGLPVGQTMGIQRTKVINIWSDLLRSVFWDRGSGGEQKRVAERETDNIWHTDSTSKK